VNDVFSDCGLTWTEILANKTGNIRKIYGLSSSAEYETAAIYAYRRDVDMLSLMIANDPEICINNTLRDFKHPYSAPDISSHHDFLARELRRKSRYSRS
jgi:hypothetical protein